MSVELTGGDLFGFGGTVSGLGGWVPEVGGDGGHGGGMNSGLPKESRRATLNRPTLLADGHFLGENDLCERNCERRVTAESNDMSKPIDEDEFVHLVDAHYEGLYRFAYSLTHTEADARDLVQDTFARLASKGGQLKSIAKAKSWLFTTLYRAFVDAHRQQARHPKVDLE